MAETQILEFPLDEVTDRIQTMRSVLSELGKSLLAYQNEVPMRASNSSEEDRALMQKADRYAEQHLLHHLKSRYPDDSTVSDEQGRIEGEGDFMWWIDPVDGTRNFIHGVPLFCTSLGLCFRDSPVAGIVLVPALDDLYHSIYGSGAYKNDAIITVSAVNSIRRTLITSGLPYERQDVISELVSDISAFVSSGTGLRRTGSTILDICWIAEGRFDAMWLQGVKG